MSYLLRVRTSSFMAGVAVASLAGLYFFQKDFNVYHHSLSQQIKQTNESLDTRISALEKLKEFETKKPAEVAE